MTNLTIPQRKALKSAADTGSAWNAWGNVYRASTNRMMQALCARGFLTHDGRPTDKTSYALGRNFSSNSLSDIKAKLEEAPAPVLRDYQKRTIATVKEDRLYECEIPGTPGRVTLAQCKEAVNAPLEVEWNYPGSPCRDDRQIIGRDCVITVSGEAFDRVTDIVECGQPNLALKALMERPSRWATSSIALDAPAKLPSYMFARHRVRTYNKGNLGLDTWKVIASKHRFYVHSYEAALRQDGRVCRIEGELREYEGKRRTPQRDRKVAKLRKILRTLKRGLYE